MTSSKEGAPVTPHQLEDCPTYLGGTPAGTQWTEEERSTPLAFAIMAHRCEGEKNICGKTVSPGTGGSWPSCWQLSSGHGTPTASKYRQTTYGNKRYLAPKEFMP